MQLSAQARGRTATKRREHFFWLDEHDDKLKRVGLSFELEDARQL